MSTVVEGARRRTGAVLTPPSPAEFALTAVTIAAVAGLARLFTGWSFLPPLAAAAVAAHMAAGVARRLELPPVRAALLSAVGLGLFVVEVIEPHSTFLGIPTPATVTALARDLGDAWEGFGRAVAPTEATRGFLLGATVVTWAAVSVADLFALRAGTRFEALVPSFTVFLFGTLLGTNRHPVPLAVAYLAAVLAFALAAEPQRWRRRLLPSGAVLTAVVLLVAALAGPRLPGARQQALVSLRQSPEDMAGGTRVTVSPLVDIRSRLVEQSDVEMFAVAAEVPAYWRLTSLDRFDGTVWSSRGSYQAADGRLDAGRATRGPEERVLQQFAIGKLASIWLPSAFRAERVEPAEGVRHDPESGSLVAEADTADGLRYTVESAVPRPDAAALATVPAAVDPAIGSRYLPLPPDVPPSVVELARQVAGDSPTLYGRALALQDWFRRDFTYSLEVAPGHGSSALERFLQSRRGYCEQFAATFAVMARALGLPARVAVGFLPGEPRADGSYLVRGRHAHAWPEVFLGGFGWVAFEPTPGRAVPGGQAYTGLEEEQAAEGPGDLAEAPVVEAPEAEGDRGEREEAGGAEQTEPAPAETAAEVSAGAPSRARVWLPWVVGAVLALAVVAALPVGLVALRRHRRRTRRQAAATPGEQVLVAWAEATEALAGAGLPRHPWETTHEYARRARASLGEAGPTLSRLAAAASAATYASREVSPATAEGAFRAAEVVEEALAEDADLLTRARRALVSPRA